MSRDRHLFVRSSGMRVVRHRVTRDRRVAVRGQPPVEHQARAGGPGRVQDRWFRRNCEKQRLFENLLKSN